MTPRTWWSYRDENEARSAGFQHERHDPQRDGSPAIPEPFLRAMVVPEQREAFLEGQAQARPSRDFLDHVADVLARAGVDLRTSRRRHRVPPPPIPLPGEVWGDVDGSVLDGTEVPDGRR